MAAAVSSGGACSGPGPTQVVVTHLGTFSLYLSGKVLTYLTCLVPGGGRAQGFQSGGDDARRQSGSQLSASSFQRSTLWTTSSPLRRVVWHMASRMAVDADPPSSSEETPRRPPTHSGSQCNLLSAKLPRTPHNKLSSPLPPVPDPPRPSSLAIISTEQQQHTLNPDRTPPPPERRPDWRIEVRQCKTAQHNPKNSVYLTHTTLRNLQALRHPTQAEPAPPTFMCRQD